MKRPGTSGFALPLALVAIALVSVSVLTLARVEAIGRSGASSMARLWRAELAAADVAARVAHLLATEPLGVRTLGVGGAGAAPVVLDGRPYAAGTRLRADTVIVGLQDEAGLINLNRTDEAVVDRLARALGADDATAQRLAATLADHVDDDALPRLYGAEPETAESAGPAGPRNAMLDDPRQAFGADGWGNQLSPLQMRTLVDATTALTLDAPVNPNTATALTLQSVFGIDASTARKLIGAREEQLLLTVDDVVARTGGGDFQSRLRPSPARSLRLRMKVAVSPSQESYVYAVRISIAEQSADRPVLIRRLGAPLRAGGREQSNADAASGLETLPESPHLRAPRGR